MRGVPIYNVNNNCATGSTALFMAQQVGFAWLLLLLLLQLQRSSHTLKLVGWYSQLIAGGIADCTLALGFEKMFRGSLPIASEDREQPIEKHMKVVRLLHTSPTSNHMTPAPNPLSCFVSDHGKAHGWLREGSSSSLAVRLCRSRAHEAVWHLGRKLRARGCQEPQAQVCLSLRVHHSSASLSHPCSSPMPA